MRSLIGHLLLVVIVAIEGAHEPVVFKESEAFPLVVDVLENHLALQKHLLLVDNCFAVAILKILSRV